MSGRIAELTRRIEDLRKRLPAHSIPPAMMAELDELEEQLAAEIARQADSEKPSSD